MENEVNDAKRVVGELVMPYLKYDGCLPECDNDINDAQRALVRAYHNQYGECWLGNVNLHRRHRGEPEPVMWKWDGETLVRNFECAFVIPRHDEVLERLIETRFSGPYEGTRVDYARVSAIIDRIREIGGEHLMWT